VFVPISRIIHTGWATFGLTGVKFARFIRSIIKVIAEKASARRNVLPFIVSHNQRVAFGDYISGGHVDIPFGINLKAISLAVKTLQ
jgi:hypothetical protein